MSTSLTVIGGVSGSSIAGIVTVPTALPSSLIAPLQAYLSDTVATSVTGGAANFQNLSVAGATGNITSSIASGVGTVGLLVISDTDTHGAIVSGAANASVNFTVTQYYNSLAIEAPGFETVNGNGASGFFAAFSSVSAVTFNSEGGSGTVAAGGPSDFVVVSGTTWTVSGDTVGGDTINAAADNSAVSVYGVGASMNYADGADTTPSNVVGLAGTAATVYSDGQNDLIETYSGSDTVSVYNSANVLVNGGADTVYAEAGNNGVKAFFNLYGGTLDFINNSTAAATVSGDVPGASGGNVTAYGGTGGGSYIGGDAGNNSLIGGAGVVTLLAAGTNNILSVSGYGNSYATQNILQAGAGGATMIAASTTGYNEFYGDTGTDVIKSSGSGKQTYYVGTSGGETLTGSTVSGATNDYIFNQDSNGGVNAIITNFKLGRDDIDINPGNSVGGVSIAGFDSLGGSHTGTIIYLSDSTTIQLYGVARSSFSNSLVGGTHI
jgi:hypothetical protein